MSRYQHAQQPKPVGTIVGAVLALGAVTIFLALMATGVIDLSPKKAPVSGPAGTVRNSLPGLSAPAAGPANPAGPMTPATASGNQGVVRFLGKFDEKANTRRVETACPACGKAVDSGIPKCPYCNADISWPEKVKCGFCYAEKPGACGVCKGSGICPFCATRPRMLYGMGNDCSSCGTTKKCPACEGSGSCGYCDGGFYYPGRPTPPRPSGKTEPPPAPNPEAGPDTPPTPADGGEPKPAPETGPAAE